MQLQDRTGIDPGPDLARQADPRQCIGALQIAQASDKFGAIGSQPVGRFVGSHKGDAFAKFTVIGIACQQRLSPLIIFRHHKLLYTVPINPQDPLRIIGNRNAPRAIAQVTQLQLQNLNRLGGGDKEAQHLGQVMALVFIAGVAGSVADQVRRVRASRLGGR